MRVTSFFFQIIDSAMKKIQNGANYVPIAIEELELCVSVIAVDAYIRCKIFKNPNIANNAIT